VQQRVHRIRVSVDGGEPVVIGWGSRDLLLDEIVHLKSSRAIRDAFEAVGTSAPVELTVEQKADVLEAIERWAARTAGGQAQLPNGIPELRNALENDVAAYA
jgi:hypothetical protein